MAFPKSKLTIMKYALASKKPIEPGVDDFLKYFTKDRESGDWSIILEEFFVILFVNWANFTYL